MFSSLLAIDACSLLPMTVLVSQLAGDVESNSGAVDNVSVAVIAVAVTTVCGVVVSELIND